MKKLIVVLFVLSIFTLSTSAYGTACYAACSGHSCIKSLDLSRTE